MNATVVALAKLDKARQMLAESRTLSEVKKIKDIAEAAKVYAKAVHLSKETQNYAAEITLLASHKAGEILSRLEKTPKQSAATVAGDSEYRRTLKETDTPERTAQHWQRIAEIPLETVAEYIEQAKATHADITQNGLTKMAMQKVKAKNPQPITPKEQPLFEPPDFTARLTVFLAELGKLSGFTHELKTKQLDTEAKADVARLIASLRKLSKDAAERADRLESALTRFAEVA